MRTAALIGLGIIVQVILLLAIFDIYFTTPIIHGVRPVDNNVPPLSERVVVISVDGLRLDALLEDYQGQPVAPYIRWIMSHRGTWGVSQSHLPTESRPGHVAMLAGFYEDPSAVTKGWKENPVDFDSIFNRSVCSFSWGSPDIVNIFYKGLTHNCSYKWVYSENQDFAGDTMQLDDWVLEQVVRFFESTGNPLLYTKSGSLFFLHLLGQDTSGHTHKPHTELYRKNLRNVDRIVKSVDDLFGKIFRDNKTAFVLTADHGMTDWGSHGAGDPSETLTPIVSWGSGIKINKGTNEQKIEQADITPLLAVLLGASIPVNSIGILPTNFLNTSNMIIAKANLLNALQISQQYLAKRTELETKSSYLIYKKFNNLNANSVYNFSEKIKDDVSRGLHVQANAKSKMLIELSLQGIDFYQKYFQRPLFVLASVSYVSWIFFLFIKVCGVERDSKASLTESFFVLSISAGASFVIYSQSLPLSFHAHVQLAIYLLWLIFPPIFTSAAYSRLSTRNNIFSGVVLVLGIELIVLGFFHRWVLGICLASIIFWHSWLYSKVATSHLNLFLFWSVSGLALGVFTFLPVVGKQPNPILNCSTATVIAILGCFIASKRTSRCVAITRSVAVLGAGLNSYFVHSSFIAEGELSLFKQYFSWILLIVSFLLLLEQSGTVIERLENAFVTLTIPFLLLSISHEGLFLLALFVHLMSWVRIEMASCEMVGSNIFYQQYTRRKLHENTLSSDDLRRAYYFLAYIYVAFFGIGNLATLNSFDPAWVRCFLTSFSPFIMTGLILFKVIIPFFAVTLAFRVVSLLLNVSPYKIFILVLIYCNLMALNFLYLVRNEGSWLDIGTSLSHYVIQQVTIVFLLVLYFASQPIITYNPRPVTEKSHFF